METIRIDQGPSHHPTLEDKLPFIRTAFRRYCEIEGVDSLSRLQTMELVEVVTRDPDPARYTLEDGTWVEDVKARLAAATPDYSTLIHDRDLS